MSWIPKNTNCGVGGVKSHVEVGILVIAVKLLLCTVKVVRCGRGVVKFWICHFDFHHLGNPTTVGHQ